MLQDGMAGCLIEVFTMQDMLSYTINTGSSDTSKERGSSFEKSDSGMNGVLHTREVSMITGVPLSVTYARIAAFNKSSDNDLAEALMNLGSGKRVRRPQDNIPDFFRAQRLNQEIKDYSRIKTNISKASALMDVATEAGEIVYNGIERMKQLVKLYYDQSTTDDERKVMKSEFSSLVKQVTHVVDNTTYDGKLLISDSQANPLSSVAISPGDVNNTIDIAFSANQVANVIGLTLGNNYDDDMSAVQEQLDKAASYLASASAFEHGLNAQYAIAEKKIYTSSASKDLITNIDSGQEVVNATNQSIKYQSSFAMLAQGNMLRSSLLRLFG